MVFGMGDTIVSYQKTGRETTANSTFSDKNRAMRAHAFVRHHSLSAGSPHLVSMPTVDLYVVQQVLFGIR